MLNAELIIDARTDLYHASLLLTGLVSLADRGEIALSLRPPRNADERAAFAEPLTIGLEIHDARSQEHRLLAIDLRDQSDIFSAHALATCDLYFKRGCYTPDRDALPVELAAKVLPFGLNFACRTRRSTAWLLGSLWPGLATQGLRGLKKIRHFLALPHAAEYEQAPDVVVEPTVVFQTRVWEESDAAEGEAPELNRHRVEIVRALREAFGDRYRGGLMPTPLALERFPQEVTAHAARRRGYTAMCRRNLIGIYTRGLFHSTAFKLPEYLAASQCIVAEKPRNELPVPLVEGVHYLGFRTTDECIAACQRLLTDPDLALGMRRANRAYYLAQVEPSARLSDIVRVRTTPASEASTPAKAPGGEREDNQSENGLGQFDRTGVSGQPHHRACARERVRPDSSPR